MSIKEIVNQFKDKKILVIGDIMLDHYIYGEVNRVSPEAPVPVVRKIKEEFRLGGAGNVAKNLYDLGAKVICSGLIGMNGDKVTEFLKKIDSAKGSYCIHSSFYLTPIKTRIIGDHQQIVRIDEEQNATSSGHVKKLTKSILELIKSGDIDAIIFSDYDKGVIDRELIGLVRGEAKEKGIITVADPKKENSKFYKSIDFLIPNEKEASDALHSLQSYYPESDLFIERLIQYLDAKAVLITRGAKGMTLYKWNDGLVNITNIPALKKQIYDVTGAGDTVASLFTLAYVSGADTLLSSKIANVGAGIVVGKMGAASVTQEELLSEWETING